MSKSLRMTAALWRETWTGLELRCAGVREAACIWGGRRTENAEIASSIVFLDDLPGVRAARAIHRTPTGATTLLFQILRSRGEEIVADVHAHPSDWVDQSITDQEHPIEFRVGLMALILPSFARGEPDLERTGVHEYLGNRKWRSWGPSEVGSHIIIERDI